MVKVFFTHKLNCVTVFPLVKHVKKNANQLFLNSKFQFYQDIISFFCFHSFKKIFVFPANEAGKIACCIVYREINVFFLPSSIKVCKRQHQLFVNWQFFPFLMIFVLKRSMDLQMTRVLIVMAHSCDVQRCHPSGKFSGSLLLLNWTPITNVDRES